MGESSGLHVGDSYRQARLGACRAAAIAGLEQAANTDHSEALMSGLVKGVGSVIGKAAPVLGSIFGGPIGGAALGALGGLLTRPKEDPRYQAQTGFLDQLQGMGAPQTAGVNPLSQEAFGLFRNLATAKPDVASFYNPYEEQVIGGINRDAAQARGEILRAADDQAAGAGAFGSRGGLFKASALGSLNKDTLGRLAQFRYGGYGDALRAAQGQQEFQAGVAGQMAGAGDYLRSVEQQGYDAPFARMAALGPLYASQLATGAAYQPRPSALSSAVGGALTGAGLFKRAPKAISRAPFNLAPTLKAFNTIGSRF